MNEVMRTVVSASAALLGASCAAVSEMDRPFIPEKAPASRTAAELSVLPRRNMPFVSATLDGKKCSLLFDTGATHTTFDIGFLRRELPETKLGEVTLAGTTNVEGAPKIFHAHSLRMGDAEFCEFEAMALDISHLMPGIGVKVDGIVGMNVIGRVPTLVSLGSGKTVFNPSPEERKVFGKGIARVQEHRFSVALLPSFNGRRFPLIVDSASTLTFLGKSTGWPSAKKKVSIGTVQVNGTSALSTEEGALGRLALGEDVEITPMLVDEPLSRIGADALLEYDMLIDPDRAYFAN